MEIIFDLETTGTDTNNDKITQYTFLNIKTNTFIASYVNPEKPIHPDAVKITGITDIDLQDKLPFTYHIQKILDFITQKNTPTFLIAHNGDSFDRQILANEFKRAGSDFPIFQYFKFIDTVKLSRALFHDVLEDHSLKSLRRYCNLSTNNSHSATKDVFDLAVVYNLFKQKMDLNKLHDLSFHYIPFGKYKGQDFRNIPQDYIYIIFL